MRLNITSLVAKVETVYATDSSPSASTDAILLAGQPSLDPLEITQEERELIRPYFGNYEMLQGSKTGKFTFSCEVAGSGTGGVAPAYGGLLRACGFSQTLLASALTGTAQVGGSSNSVKLAAGASAVDDFYLGMPMAITAGTGNGQSGLIVDYNGTSKIATVVSAAWVAPDATSSYSIAANAAYKPISTLQESATMYFNLEGVQHKFVGVRGNVKLSIGANKRPLLTFEFMGLYQPVADASVPACVYTAWIKPLLANKANTPFFSLHGASNIGLESFDLDVGNELEFNDLINGTEEWIQVDRKTGASISLDAVTVATKDWWSIITNNTIGAFGLTQGLAAGNRFSISSAATNLLNPKYGERKRQRTFKPEMRFLPTQATGNDDFAIAIW